MVGEGGGEGGMVMNDREDEISDSVVERVSRDLSVSSSVVDGRSMFSVISGSVGPTVVGF